MQALTESSATSRLAGLMQVEEEFFQFFIVSQALWILQLREQTAFRAEE